MADLQQLTLPSLENLPLEYLQTEEQDIVEEIEEYDLVEVIEKITAFRFQNSNLLQQAFTHSTYDDEDNCRNYQRLEFLGDSILNHLIAEDLYFSYPDLHPGTLTNLRAANVDTEKLARVAIKYSFHKYLRHKKPLLAGQIEAFEKAILEYPLHSYGLIDAPKVLADIVESLIAAIHIDSDRSWNKTWQVVKKLLEPMITLETLEKRPTTKLHELCQKHGLTLQTVDLYWKQNGEIKVYVDGELAGRGEYISKKTIARNRAANDAYNKITIKLSSEENIDEGENNSQEQ